MKDKDERMNATSEVFNHIKIIKANAWYTLSNNLLTAEIAFPVITLINALYKPIQSIPIIIQSLVEANNSVQRLQKFLLVKELDISFIKSSHLQKEFDKNLISQKNNQFNEAEQEQQEDEEILPLIDTFSQKTQKIEYEKYQDFAIVVKNGTFYWGIQQIEQKQVNMTRKQKRQLKKKEEKIIKQMYQDYKLRQQNEINRKFEHTNYSDIDISGHCESLQLDLSIQTTIIPGQNNIQSTDNSQKVLKNLNLEIPKGKMVAFIGDVGAGKSSFLYSLLGEMLYDNQEYQEGEQLLQQNPQVHINGSISLVNQKPWMVSDTIENNILFGKPLNRQRYEQTIQNCSLTRDFTVLQNGDQTIIGEQGVNLSGGQKARISLARAVYSDSDIILLDDILSAVDVHVGQKIIKDCMIDFLKDKTRVLITHALYYMKYMDYIYLMDNGEIIEQGTYDEMINSQQFKNIFEKIMRKNNDSNYEDIDEEEEQLEYIEFSDENKQQNQKLINNVIPSDIYINYNTEQQENSGDLLENDINKQIEELEQRKSNKAKKSFQQQQATLIKQKQKEENIRNSQKTILQIKEQQQQKGNQEDLFVKEERKKGKVSMTYYWIYAKYNGGIFYILGLVLFAFLSQIMKLYSNIWLGFWISKSDETDFDQKDNNFYLFWFTILSLGISFCALFWASISILCNFKCIVQLHKQMIIHLIYAPLNEFFDRVPQGRILNVLSKDINIMDTQIPMSIQDIFISIFGVLCTISLSAYASTPYILQAALFSHNQDSSKTGLVLTFSLNINLIVNSLLDSIRQTEENFVSFERCHAYLSIESEKGFKEFLDKRPELIKQKQPLHNKIPELENWPQNGVVEFRDVYVRYRENLETVLNGLSFKVESNQKIGIVGRTGAGKSTITLCILRILELLKGQIIIDGQDISLLSLDELRSKITIILQDPSLFQGTLRKNLDPLGELSDLQLIDTMNKCNLGRFLQEREGLDTQIQDGGGNLSVGEKQLICIARALLKKSKVVLIDEATANIDIQTEQMIQETIKAVFKECTVLTIAHRINTILESDKILVMDSGKLSEFDAPQKLLQNPDSLFYSLNQQALKEHNL
ncbi:P-loop containing nucleoside triphosphate hydrolase [Pseudocohnilembus persalinus]|uniref:p-loop containing nucleoside triphosphate hydrolase n=1 Tax=Pseudocohnilembus persalinus TaxID=266149 RepID=A0A0V0R061_PSEPJ|nr:P-loop containing nucleoside triphosphate hydrolase [Pseudocohnilembus persalinus]|eukprot:KRX07926.1 P-loop containing nucleoside triphosphate hydrolase [Pseudocohnilembus persalinus]